MLNVPENHFSRLEQSETCKLCEFDPHWLVHTLKAWFSCKLCNFYTRRDTNVRFRTCNSSKRGGIQVDVINILPAADPLVITGDTEQLNLMVLDITHVRWDSLRTRNVRVL